MAKKIIGYVKLQVPAGKATPAPPIGPALGQRKLNIMEFCKAFNARTQSMEAGTPVPVVITVYADNSFTFVTKTPPVSYFLKKVANLKSGSADPAKKIVAKLTKVQIKQIAEMKMPDLNANDIDAAMKIVEGTARSMGIVVTEG